MSVEDLAEALHGIVAEMEAPEQEQTVSKEEVIACLMSYWNSSAMKEQL